MEEKDTALGRREILEQAALCVCQDREKQYGSPENNFARIAALWNAYIPLGFTAHDVGIMLALLKIGRIASGQTKGDNYIDLAGYAACAGEIALNKPTVDMVNPATDKPVEPWGEEDNERRDRLICGVGRCNPSCVFKEKANADELESCMYWCEAHPAEARKIMDEMEGEK